MDPDFSDSFSDKEVSDLIEGDAFFDDCNLRRNTYSKMFDSKTLKSHPAKYIIKGHRVSANGRTFIGNVSEYKTSEGSFYFYGSMTLKNRTLIFQIMAGKAGDDHKKILDFMARSVFFLTKPHQAH